MSGILILVIYTVLMLAVTLILTRKNKSTEFFRSTLFLYGIRDIMYIQEEVM